MRVTLCFVLATLLFCPAVLAQAQGIDAGLPEAGTTITAPTRSRACCSHSTVTDVRASLSTLIANTFHEGEACSSLGPTCLPCSGTGYITCGNCGGSGITGQRTVWVEEQGHWEYVLAGYVLVWVPPVFDPYTPGHWEQQAYYEWRWIVDVPGHWDTVPIYCSVCGGTGREVCDVCGGTGHS